MSKERVKAKLVVGKWIEDKESISGETFFKPLPEQPDAPLTDMAAMLSWARANLKDSPGEYSFVRQVPGKLTIESRTTIKTTFA